MSHTKITRKLRQGAIEIDSQSPCALVVHFVLEMVNVDESGRVLHVLEAKQETKTVQVDRAVLLSTASKGSTVSVAGMASGIVNSCKYIHPSRTEEVEQILIRLRRQLLEKEEERSLSPPIETPLQSKGESSAKALRQHQEELPPARLQDVDDYLEMLYQVSAKPSNRGSGRKGSDDDGLLSQVRGTAMILQLCRKVDNLEYLVQNSTLMGALARILQEEYKKSTELTFNLLKYGQLPY